MKYIALLFVLLVGLSGCIFLERPADDDPNVTIDVEIANETEDFAYHADDAEDSIELYSASIDGEYLNLAYEKNFDTAAHIWFENRTRFDQIINFIGGNGVDLSVSQNMNSFGRHLVPGERIQICHGNNGNLCSDVVTITGQGVAQEVEVFGCAVPAGFQANVNPNHAIEGECRFDTPRFMARDDFVPIGFSSAAAFCEAAGMSLVEGTTVPVLEIGNVVEYSDSTWKESQGNSYFDSVRCS